MPGKADSLFQLVQDRAAYTYNDRVLAADSSNELAIYMREGAGFEMFLEGLLRIRDGTAIYITVNGMIVSGHVIQCNTFLPFISLTTLRTFGYI